MRDFAAEWPQLDFATAVARLPWGHLTDLLDRLPDARTRDWYAERAVREGWSRRLLQDRIKGQLHARAGAAPSNFVPLSNRRTRRSPSRCFAIR